MHSSLHSPAGPRAMLWTGVALKTLVVLFMIVDGVMKVVKPEAVVSAMTELGYPDDLTFGIGIIGLACTLLYALPRTSALGAILLTAYFGGAISAKARLEETSLLFAVAMGVITWGGLYFCDERLRALIPLRDND